MDETLFAFVGGLFVYCVVAIIAWAIAFSEELAVTPPDEAEAPTATIFVLACCASGALLVRNTFEMSVLIGCVVWCVTSVIGTVKQGLRPPFTFWDVAIPLVAVAYFGGFASHSVQVGMLRTFATPAMLGGVVMLTVLATILASNGRLNPWTFVFSAGSTACAALFALACFEVAQYLGWIGDVRQATTPLLVCALASSLLFVVLTLSRAILRSDKDPSDKYELVEDVRSFFATMAIVLILALGSFVTYAHIAWSAPSPLSLLR